MRLERVRDDGRVDLVARMREAEILRADFLARLDATRTVTLADLLERGAPSKACLGARWIDMRRLRSRFGALADAFLSRLPPTVPGLARLPLVFLQSSSPDEDAREFAERRAKFGGMFTERFGERPPQACYLHTETNFFGDLVEGPHGRIIRPLGAFSSKSLALEERDAGWRQGPTVVGYRIPDYPGLLGVSAATATDYLARLLIHDIGHGVMNPTPPEAEGVHNVLMIWAMQAKPTPRRLRALPPWEALVLSECTDPFFCLEGWLVRHAEGRLASGDGASTPLREALLAQYRKWYFSPSAKRKREKAWRYAERWNPGMDEQDWIRSRIGRFIEHGIPLYEDRNSRRLAA